MEVYLHLQRAKHSFDKVKGVPSLKRGLVRGRELEKHRTPPALQPPPLIQEGEFIVTNA